MTTLPVLPVAGRIVVLSLETWDDIWRRNQHLAARLVRLGYVGSLSFVTPPRPGLAPRAHRRQPEPDIEVVRPPLVIPRRWGGHRAIGLWQRRNLHGIEAIWVNDPVAGAQLAATGLPMLYDVTDDWRSMPQSEADRRRIIEAEDLLASRATTVVCSGDLADRWRQRYGVDPVLVPNGVDTSAIRSATPAAVRGQAPHAIYVGTLHSNRIDVPLLLDLAARWPGTLHLVGPLHLEERTIERLRELGADLVGPVPFTEVPPWLQAADVLLSPHLVDDFTLSLDAIKSYEYLATDKPIVATPSSGFQRLTTAGLTVAPASGFLDAAIAAAGRHVGPRDIAVDWDQRAADFASALAAACDRGQSR